MIKSTRTVGEEHFKRLCEEKKYKILKRKAFFQCCINSECPINEFCVSGQKVEMSCSFKEIYFEVQRQAFIFVLLTAFYGMSANQSSFKKIEKPPEIAFHWLINVFKNPNRSE